MHIALSWIRYFRSIKWIVRILISCDILILRNMEEAPNKDKSCRAKKYSISRHAGKKNLGTSSTSVNAHDLVEVRGMGGPGTHKSFCRLLWVRSSLCNSRFQMRAFTGFCPEPRYFSWHREWLFFFSLKNTTIVGLCTSCPGRLWLCSLEFIYWIY